ncbi:MAG: hypothetical protein ACU84Q_09235 [Gammaproteobacteria bacterium]
MNWDALGAIGELVGAAAVVISVVYLAIQIRRQTEQEKLSASRELAETWNQCLKQVAEDKQFAELWLAGAANYGGLPNTERIRLSSYLYTMMRTLEQQYLHIQKGHLDPDFFESAQNTFAEVLRLPGVQEFWEINRDNFSKGFGTFVDAQVAAARAKGYESSFRDERENPSDKALESDA